MFSLERLLTLTKFSISLLPLNVVVVIRDGGGGVGAQSLRLKPFIKFDLPNMFSAGLKVCGGGGGD